MVASLLQHTKDDLLDLLQRYDEGRTKHIEQLKAMLKEAVELNPKVLVIKKDGSIE